jgi:hypothetical protein
MAYKYNKTIVNGAETLISGIENIELFLDDDDDWNFHDSQIYSFHWDGVQERLTISIIPIGYGTTIEEDKEGVMLLVDFHFEKVDNLNINFYLPEYILDMSITKNKYGLDCYIDGIAHIICRSMTVDKPRFVPKEVVR